MGCSAGARPAIQRWRLRFEWTWRSPPPALPLLMVLGSLALLGCGSLSTIRVRPVLGSIRVDGRLDDRGWQASRVVRTFETVSGPDRIPSAEISGPMPLVGRCRASFVWDEQFLYVGFFCDDRDIQLASSGGPGDWVELVVVAEEDPASVVRFRVDPRGVCADSPEGFSAAGLAFGSMEDPGDEDRAFSVELKIPLAALGLEPIAFHRSESFRFLLVRRHESRGWSQVESFPPVTSLGEGDFDEYGVLSLEWR